MGTRINVITVANTTPQPNEIAMGIMNLEPLLCSNINGSRPAKVVIDVRRIGRNRRTPADRTASPSFTPSFTRAEMKCTMMRLSFTTTPDS